MHVTTGPQIERQITQMVHRLFEPKANNIKADLKLPQCDKQRSISTMNKDHSYPRQFLLQIPWRSLLTNSTASRIKFFRLHGIPFVKWTEDFLDTKYENLSHSVYQMFNNHSILGNSYQWWLVRTYFVLQPSFADSQRAVSWFKKIASFVRKL